MCRFAVEACCRRLLYAMPPRDIFHIATLSLMLSFATPLLRYGAAMPLLRHNNIHRMVTIR